MHSFLQSLLKFYSKQKFVRFCYLVVFISTLLFANGYLFYPFCVKNNAVQYRSLWWEKSHEIVIKMLRVEKLELTPLSERICGLKLVQIEPQLTRPKRGLCCIYQLTVLLVEVERTIFSENSEPVWDVHMRIHVAPLACYPFINIKLAAYHLLLYVVYLCQKS